MIIVHICKHRDNETRADRARRGRVQHREHVRLDTDLRRADHVQLSNEPYRQLHVRRRILVMSLPVDYQLRAG